MEAISRKNFIKKTGKAGIALCAGLTISALMQSCKTIQRVEAPLLDDIIRINGKYLEREEQLLVENEALPAPVYIRHNDKEGYTALLMLCTHKECEINPTGEVFTCPCHGSQFGQDGEVLSGPAETALTEFKTELIDGELFIYLNQIIKK